MEVLEKEFKRFRITLTAERCIFSVVRGGLVLLNGQAKRGLNFDSLVRKAATQSGFKTFTAKEVKSKQETRYKNYNEHDYEAGTGKGANTRGMSKLVYRPKRGR